MANILTKTSDFNDFQQNFITAYFQLIVSSPDAIKQLLFWGRSYLSAINDGKDSLLLTPIAVSRARGSITATQGHLPEATLRKYMQDWGMIPDTDFNLQDVDVSEVPGHTTIPLSEDDSKKRRKYDFVLPFRSRGIGKRLFIQCQFYAGDSGSVSHKVVDQTDAARAITQREYPNAVFLEYLDGAGYYASLNGDLKKMLEKSTTTDFFQIRSAPIKLRRQLQSIEFISPLEIEQAIIRCDGTYNSVVSVLVCEGYSNGAVVDAVQRAIQGNLVEQDANNVLSVRKERAGMVRRYCLLDVIANFGSPVPENAGNGFLTVPGYQTRWGMRQNEAVAAAVRMIPSLQDMWNETITPFNDIQWLLDNKFVILK